MSKEQYCLLMISKVDSVLVWKMRNDVFRGIYNGPSFFFVELYFVNLSYVYCLLRVLRDKDRDFSHLFILLQQFDCQEKLAHLFSFVPIIRGMNRRLRLSKFTILLRC